MLVVETMVRVTNRTGKKLLLCQPRRATVDGAEAANALEIPADGTPVPWVWARPIPQVI